MLLHVLLVAHVSKFPFQTKKAKQCLYSLLGACDCLISFLPFVFSPDSIR